MARIVFIKDIDISVCGYSNSKSERWSKIRTIEVDVNFNMSFPKRIEDSKRVICKETLTIVPQEMADVLSSLDLTIFFVCDIYEETYRYYFEGPEDQIVWLKLNWDTSWGYEASVKWIEEWEHWKK